MCRNLFNWGCLLPGRGERCTKQICNVGSKILALKDIRPRVKDQNWDTLLLTKHINLKVAFSYMFALDMKPKLRKEMLYV